MTALPAGRSVARLSGGARASTVAIRGQRRGGCHGRAARPRRRRRSAHPRFHPGRAGVGGLWGRHGRQRAGGVERIAERPPALILLDLQLPRTDGWEVFNRVRALGLAVPVVLATVVTSARAQAERLGFDAFLAKPFSLDELLAVVGCLTPPAAGEPA